MAALYALSDLVKSMSNNSVDMEHFSFCYANVNFDVILDISTQPFELMVGTKRHNWACVMEMYTGYKVEMSDEDFYRLRSILNLNSNDKNKFNSCIFLKFLAGKAPKKSSGYLLDPSYVVPFRKSQISKSDEPEKIVFIGWNDHSKDHRKAQNFDKTQLLLGKRCADYCRKHNISSMWTTPDKAKLKTHVTYPWERIFVSHR